MRYKGLQWVTGGYNGLEGITRGYTGLCYGMVWYGNFIYTQYFLQVHLHSRIKKLTT